MLYLSNFARPQGAKDKEPRKKRGTLGNLAIGTGVGAVGGLGAGKVLSDKFIYNIATEGMLDDDIAKTPKEAWKLLNKRIKEDKTGELRKGLKKVKYDTFKGFAPRTIAAGAGIGLAGTGAYLGGRAIIKRLKKKNESNRKG